MAETALESVYFRRKIGPSPVGFPNMLSRYHHPGAIHVTIRHTDQKRPETDADGRWRKQTEADGSRKMEETALGPVDFLRKFGSGPVGSPDILSRHHHPVNQTCCHRQDFPGAGRNGSWRKMADADGSRRKLTEAENWQKQP